MTMREDGSYKSEYSTTGDSSYTTLTSKSTGADLTSQKPNIKLNGSQTGGASPKSSSVSHFNFTIYEGYADSGVFVSDAVTAGGTINNDMIAINSTTPTDTSITMTASADNGSNYEAHTVNAYHSYTNTGTQLKIKATLAQTTAGDDDTPELAFYGAQWMEQ